MPVGSEENNVGGRDVENNQMGGSATTLNMNQQQNLLLTSCSHNFQGIKIAEAIKLIHVFEAVQRKQNKTE